MKRGAPLRVLLVAGAGPDAELLDRMLRKAFPDVAPVPAPRLVDAVRALERSTFDVVLLDPSLLDVDGLEALALLRQAGGPEGGPVVVVSDRGDVDATQRALLEGAQDHLLKDELAPHTLARAVRYAVAPPRAETVAGDSRAWAQSVLDSIDNPTCALDRDGTVLATNVAWQRFTLANGGDPGRCGTGSSYLAACEGVDDPAVQALSQDLRRMLSTGQGRIEMDYPCHSAREQRWFSLRATPAVGWGAAVITHVDVSALRQAQDALSSAALHDPLTGLANRRLLVQNLEQRLRTCRADQAVAVVCVDIDHFKPINDSCGHAIGDALLVRIGAEIVGAARLGDVVARLGGDEFVVLGDVMSPEEATALAERVHTATSRKVSLDGYDLDVSTSIGVVVSRGGGRESADDILSAVDVATHEAKQQGRCHVQVDSEVLQEQARQRGRLYREMVAALERDEFRLHYQPIVAPQAGGVHLVEALLRWEHPERGLLGTDAFLDLAEATGLIVPIGAWVIGEACRQGRELHDAGLHLGVSLNISAKQLNDPITLQLLQAALAETGFPPTSLIIEVTETTMIDDTESSLSAMHALKALGVQLVIDDFGTGYSSPAYLKRYPVDGIKIDRSFVRDVVHNADDRAIVVSIIKLARALDLWVVAEGIETVEQLASLTEMGCELIQGYLFSRPVSADRLPHVARQLCQAAPPVAAQAAAPAAAAASAAARLVASAEDVTPDLAARMTQLVDVGHSLHTVAAMLNSEGLRTPLGLRWHPRSVARCVAVESHCR